jgi:K+-transporting ATPase ATPase C chain
MLRELRPAFVLLLLMTVVTGLAYPLAITGLGQALFPFQANGSVLTKAGQPIGSALIGQNFTRPEYFHPRPSATTDTDPKDPTKTIPAPYNAMNSGASNLAPTAQALADRVKADLAALQAENPGAKVPADLLTSSASGLDPDISPASALFQAPRVAQARHLPLERVKAVIAEHIEGRLAGLFGEPRVNVLALNLALDALH